MRNVRTCSHIKVNGVKCGSPALRHQTLCYFHYQWDRRERRRVRLGGPVGTNKNTGIELPILEGPESIMLAIMEVQHALLDARIDRLTAHTLLYSLQLATQLKIGSLTGLSDRHHTVSTCRELESDLELDSARGLRPSAKVCSACPETNTCISPRSCPNTPSHSFCHADPELVEGEASLSTPLTSTPTVLRSSVPPISGSSLASSPSSRPERAAVARGVEGPASSPATTALNSSTPTLNPCHPERSAAVSRGAEGPFVSSSEATILKCATERGDFPNAAVETRNFCSVRGNDRKNPRKSRERATTDLHPSTVARGATRELPRTPKPRTHVRGYFLEPVMSLTPP